MPQARREPRFTARDVLDIVLNGESDVDIDFTETDEESDEEACGEEYKENQPPSEPSDCPVDADIQSPQLVKHTQPRERYQWQKKNFISPNTDFSGPSLTEDVSSLHTPLQYFRRFVSQDMIDSLTTNTNVYSLQKTGTSVNTSRKEIEQMIGMHLKMGLVQMNGCRMYWEADTRHAPVADVMPRNRFQSLLTSLHLVDNSTAPEREKQDKLWKIRPWLNSFREKCLRVVPEEHNCVGEMMIPFKGRFSSIKQYMRGKPHPWGFKVWVRTGISGIMCDFDVYQGSSGGVRAKSELGLSGDVVMKLASTLPSGQNYKIYADNFFTSALLVERLLGHGIHYVGTARQVRLPNCTLEDDKSLERKGRGAFDYRVEKNHNIAVVKWYDNRAVTLVSSFAGPEPVEATQRWDKANKTYIEVQRPYIVGTYNKYMGGVDLLDSFTAKYKFPLKSRRWYMYIFWHTIALAVINAWLLYKRDCEALKVPQKDVLKLRLFQAQLASSLILVDASSSQKRQLEVSPNRNPRKAPRQHRPSDVRQDRVGHFPRKTQRGRCRNSGCSGYTNLLCHKCDVRLCISGDRNCFWDYHC